MPNGSGNPPNSLDFEDVVAAKEIIIASKMTLRQRTARIGVSGKALRRHLLADSGLRFWPGISIIRNRTGQPVGFALPGIRVNYAQPATLTKLAGVTTWQGPSKSIDRSVRCTAEKHLVAALRRTGPNWYLALRVAGLATVSPSIGVRSMIANVLVNEMIENSVPDELDGRLATIRMCPPSLRSILSGMVMMDTTAARFAAELVVNVPIVLLWPRLVRSFLGQKRSKVLEALGLPRHASRIKFGAVGTLAYRLNTQAFDALPGELDWLTDKLCRSMPRADVKQRAVVDLAALVSLSENCNCATRVENVALWYAKSLDVRPYTCQDDGRKAREAMCAYIIADLDLIDTLGLDPWSPKNSWERVTDNLTLFRDRISKHRSGAKAPFPIPRLAIKEGKLPQSDWEITRLKSEQELITEGNEMSHCVGSYALACWNGGAIYTIRRDPLPGDKGKRIKRHKYLGATLHVVERAGQIQIVQLLGPMNEEPPQSLRSAVWRLVDANNAGLVKGQRS